MPGRPAADGAPGAPHLTEATMNSTASFQRLSYSSKRRQDVITPHSGGDSPTCRADRGIAVRPIRSSGLLTLAQGPVLHGTSAARTSRSRPVAGRRFPDPMPAIPLPPAADILRSFRPSADPHSGGPLPVQSPGSAGPPAQFQDPLTRDCGASAKTSCKGFHLTYKTPVDAFSAGPVMGSGIRTAARGQNPVLFHS